MIEHSEDIKTISGALLKAQKEIGAALKNAKNPYFESHYADMKAVIDAIKEPLNKNGIVFLQAVNGTGEGMPVVETMLLHEGGQYLCSKAPVYCQKPNNPQAFGTGITYTKRYALQAFLGLPTEDDDGNAASAPKDKKPAKPKEKFQDVLDLAYKKFGEKHQLYIEENDNVSLDYDKFVKAVAAPKPKGFGKLPTVVGAIPQILEKIKLSDVMVEAKKTPPAEPSESGKNEHLEQAFFNFQTENKNDLAGGFVYDMELFKKAIIKHFKVLPIKDADIGPILKKIKPMEVIKEL